MATAGQPGGFKMFADETEQRDGREQRGGARRGECLLLEDVVGDDDNDDDDSDEGADNVHVDDDSHVNGAAVPARRIRCIDIVRGRLAAAMPTATARRSVSCDDRPGHRRVFRDFAGLVVRGDQQLVDERHLLRTRVAEKTRPCLVQ